MKLVVLEDRKIDYYSHNRTIKYTFLFLIGLLGSLFFLFLSIIPLQYKLLLEVIFNFICLYYLYKSKIFKGVNLTTFSLLILYISSNIALLLMSKNISDNFTLVRYYVYFPIFLFLGIALKRKDAKLSKFLYQICIASMIGTLVYVISTKMLFNTVEEFRSLSKIYGSSFSNSLRFAVEEKYKFTPLIIPPLVLYSISNIRISSGVIQKLGYSFIILATGYLAFESNMRSVLLAYILSIGTVFLMPRSKMQPAIKIVIFVLSLLMIFYLFRFIIINDPEFIEQISGKGIFSSDVVLRISILFDNAIPILNFEAISLLPVGVVEVPYIRNGLNIADSTLLGLNTNYGYFFGILIYISFLILLIYRVLKYVNTRGLDNLVLLSIILVHVINMINDYYLLFLPDVIITAILVGYCSE